MATGGYVDIFLNNMREANDPKSACNNWWLIKDNYINKYRNFLPEDLLKFIEEAEVVTEEDLERLRQENIDLHVKDDPRVCFEFLALIPKVLYKLMHVFGYPKMRINGDGWFYYLFKYKGHFLLVSDMDGVLDIMHMTPHPKGEASKSPPQDGAEEILNEFSDFLLKFAITAIPLNFADTFVFL
ncbi:MAG: hypothetical protein DRO00_03970 [Thermoproteota archaeon]|nr:MAG: hypothetical protein DRO00_03970 [Candidatus Korarchaeota archaeon]